MVVKVFERMFSGDPFEVLRIVLNLPWRCRSLAPGPSKDPGNRVKGEKWRSLLTLGNSTTIRLAKLCPEKRELRRFEVSSIFDFNFTPWAKSGRSRGSSWPCHTFFKFPESEFVESRNPRPRVGTYALGRPSQCIQGEWSAPPPISSLSRNPLVHQQSSHAGLPSHWIPQIHLWSEVVPQGQRSSGPSSNAFEICFWKNFQGQCLPIAVF